MAATVVSVCFVIELCAACVYVGAWVVVVVVVGLQYVHAFVFTFVHVCYVVKGMLFNRTSMS